MKGWLITIFSSIMLLICSNAEASNITKTGSDTTVKADSLIVVRFVLKRNASADFQYYDKFGSFKRFVFLKMPTDTVFQKILTSKTPLELYSSYGRRIPFFLFPGDTITFIVNDQKIQAASSINTLTEANFFNMANTAKQSIFDYESRSNFLKLPERLPLLDLLYSRSIELLEGKKDSLSPEVYSIYAAAIDYEYLRYKLLRLGVDNSVHLPNLRDSIDHLVKEEKKYYLNEFMKMLEVYNKVKWGRDFNNPDYYKRMYDSSNTYYSGAIRDRMLLLRLMGIRNKAPNYLDEYLSRFYKDCSNSEYIKYIQANFVDTGTSKVQELKAIDSERKSWNKLLQSHRGKVVYIDFWASWCIPCRREMPGAKNLVKAYDNNVFSYVFISIDDLLTDWKEACREENILNYEYNYLLPNSGNTQIGKLLKISSIPRYVLIDKKGEIVDRNAPAPAQMIKNRIIDKWISKR